MNVFLRKATASQSRALGPFISDTDFKTVQNGLTIANTDIKLVVNGGASANKNSGGGTNRVNGMYGVTFDATDTATVGEMQVTVLVSGALVVFAVFEVLEAAVYDALFASSAPGYLQPTTAGRTLDVASTGEAGVDFANINMPTGAIRAFGILDSDNASALPDSTHLTLASKSFGTNTLAGRSLWMFSGTNGVGEVVTIDSNTNASPSVVAFKAPAITFTGTVGYVIFAQANPSDTNLPAVNPTQWAGTTIPTPNVTGVPIVDWKYVLGSILTESTPGWLAAAIKKFFNIGSPASTMDALTLVATASAVTNPVTAGTVTDKTGYALTSAYDPAKTAAQAGAAMTLTSGERLAVADALLARNQQGGATSSPTVSQALAGGLMSLTISGGTLTVKNGDGTTAYTRTLSRSALDAIVSSL